jgi:hypothetical protein
VKREGEEESEEKRDEEDLAGPEETHDGCRREDDERTGIGSPA